MNVPILLYHRIDTVPVERDPLRLAVPPDTFSSHMRYLHERGYHCLPLQELLLLRAQNRPLPERSFVLTFDDGYRDFFTKAYPVIKEYGWTATVFLAAEYIGRESGWTGATGPLAAPLMNWEEILEMQAGGIIFGSHTLTHRRLPDLDTAEATREIKGSKDLLDKRLGAGVTLFSYPYEALDGRIKAIVADSGYFGACGFSRSMDEDNFCLWRVECRGEDSMARFRFGLSGLRRQWTRLKTRSMGARFLRRGIERLRS